MLVLFAEPEREDHLFNRDITIQDLITGTPEPAHTALADDLRQPVTPADQRLMASHT
jgi:hypothetical protein